MKKGNQFYLKVQLFDENDNLINILSINKVQFNIGNLTKVFDYLSEENEEVEYDEESQAFKIWITEQESFNFENETKIDARVLYKNDIIDGSLIKQIYFHNSLNEVLLDDSAEDN